MPYRPTHSLPVVVDADTPAVRPGGRARGVYAAPDGAGQIVVELWASTGERLGRIVLLARLVDEAYLALCWTFLDRHDPSASQTMDPAPLLPACSGDALLRLTA